MTRKSLIREWGTGYLFILPGVFFVAVFITYPLLQSLLLAFFRWKGVGEWKFVGFENYAKMFTADRFFPLALQNSIVISLGTTVGTVGLGFIFAVLIDLRVRLWRFYRFVYFLPVVISVAAISLLWQRILDPYGLLNTILGRIGLAHAQHN